MTNQRGQAQAPAQNSGKRSLVPAPAHPGTNPVISLEGRPGAFKIQKYEMEIPEEYAYIIAYGRNGEVTGGFEAVFYDRVSTEIGMKFGAGKVLRESEWAVQVQIPCQYYNAKGQLCTDDEIYEFDALAKYQHSRATWKREEWDDRAKRKVVVDKPKVEISYDDEGNPHFTYILPPEAEESLWRTALQDKRFKMARAITCCQRRMTARAIGLKGFKARRGEGWNQNLVVNLYRFVPDAVPESMRQVDDLFGGEQMERGIEGAKPADVIHGQHVDPTEHPPEPPKEKPKPTTPVTPGGVPVTKPHPKAPPTQPHEPTPEERSQGGGKLFDSPEDAASFRGPPPVEDEPRLEKFPEPGQYGYRVEVKGDTRPHKGTLYRMGLIWGPKHERRDFGYKWVATDLPGYEEAQTLANDAMSLEGDLKAEIVADN